MALLDRPAKRRRTSVGEVAPMSVRTLDDDWVVLTVRDDDDKPHEYLVRRERRQTGNQERR